MNKLNSENLDLKQAVAQQDDLQIKQMNEDSSEGGGKKEVLAYPDENSKKQERMI